jgi:hypothetical protein
MYSLTGAYADQIFNAVGLRKTRIRYTGIEIIPTPLISNLSVQINPEFSSPITPNEPLTTWQVTIPVGVLNPLLATALATKLAELAANPLFSGSSDYSDYVARWKRTFDPMQATSADSVWEVNEAGVWEKTKVREDQNFYADRYLFNLIPITNH